MAATGLCKLYAAPLVNLFKIRLFQRREAYEEKRNKDRDG